MPAYDLTAPYSPKGDQPTAIKQLVAGVNSGERYQTLLGRRALARRSRWPT